MSEFEVALPVATEPPKTTNSTKSMLENWWAISWAIEKGLKGSISNYTGN
jgi:hypothetical protein